LAHRTHGATDEFGRHGWWTQDEKQRSKAVNPLFPNDGQMHDVVKKEIEKVIVRHHVSRSNHQQAYATTLYAKKAKDTYVAREVFTSLTPKNLSSIWPEIFASYCEAAWRRYSDESPDIDGELKRTKNCPHFEIQGQQTLQARQAHHIHFGEGLDSKLYFSRKTDFTTRRGYENA
jgi:hypothetical protein